MRMTHKVGDFVVREGSFAKILKFSTIGSNRYIEVELIPSEEKISWPLDSTVQTIETSKEHLHVIGFEKKEDIYMIDAKKHVSNSFFRNDIVISGFMLKNYGEEYSILKDFNSGFCIANFRNGVDVEKYKEADIINSEKFHADFPNVMNINDLFEQLEKRGVSIEEEDKVRISTLRPNDK